MTEQPKYYVHAGWKLDIKTFPIDKFPDNIKNVLEKFGEDSITAEVHVKDGTKWESLRIKTWYDKRKDKAMNGYIRAYYFFTSKKHTILVIDVTIDGIPYYINMIRTMEIKPFALKKAISAGAYGPAIQLEDKIMFPVTAYII
jgi:hypothetical protein